MDRNENKCSISSTDKNEEDYDQNGIFSPNLSVVEEAPGGESTVASTAVLTADQSALQLIGAEDSFKQHNSKSAKNTTPCVNALSSGGKHVKSTDFRCEWKESCGVSGGIKSYGLRIRYFADQRTMIKIDGISGQWEATTLDGAYGPVNEYDLFIGAKIKVFGRHLTITSANASVCHEIEEKAQKLKKQISFMQNSIENVGAVPILRRAAPVQMRHVTRGAKAEGHVNLRKLANDVSKLSEQMYNLGLDEVVKAMTVSKSWKTSSTSSTQLPIVASAQPL